MTRGRETWRAYAAGSEIDHFAKFCREHLIQSDDRWEGKPLVLWSFSNSRVSGAAAADPLAAPARQQGGSLASSGSSPRTSSTKRSASSRRMNTSSSTPSGKSGERASSATA
jgi:hypothetical protein